jgi:parvulin-like peptidyl-prolyl isomerase
VSVAIAASLFATSCGGLLAPAAAVVNGKKIPVDEVQQAVDDFRRSREFERLSQQGDSAAITRDFEQSYMSTLIRRAVLAPEAAALDVVVSDDEVQAQMDQIQAEFPSESAFQEALKEQGLTVAQLELLVRDRALEEELRSVVTEREGPTDSELRAYYDGHLGDFQETETNHILVKDRAPAARLSRRLRATPKRQVRDLFSRLAKMHSKDKSNKDVGGSLGFNPSGSFVPAFEEAAADLPIGGISQPVKTRFGWHVIWVTGRRPTPFDQVREQVQVALGAPSDDELWDRWLLDAYRDAGVKVNPRYGEFNLETQQVEDVSARTIPGAEEGRPDLAPSPEASLTAP